MDTDTREKRGRRKGLALGTRFPGSRPWPRGLSLKLNRAAAKQPSPNLGEARSLFRCRVPNLFSKFSRDRSKVPAKSKAPKPDTESLRPDDIPPRLDTEPPKQVLTSKEILERIIELVHQALGPDAITLDGQADVQNLVSDIRRDLQKNLTNGSSRKKISKILKRFEYYFRVVDVAIQHQPKVVQIIAEIGNLSNPAIVIQITALVWAGVRTIVQVSTAQVPKFLKYGK